MNDLFKRNLKALGSVNDGLAGVIESSLCDGITPVATKDGDFVPQVDDNGRKIFLHSKFDPKTEARRFLGEIATGEYSLYVVAGFGYGYHAQALLESMGSDATLLILEKSAGIVRSAMEHRDLSALLGDRRVVLLINPDEDEIAQRMKGRSSKTAAFVTHRGSSQVNADYYAGVIRTAKSYISMKDANIATLAKFEKLWSSNIARNISIFLSSPPVSALYGAFSGIPAIVVAAGPSLTESIPFIRKNIDRAVVIAVDTSYFVLRRHGIEPHFCVSVDPQVINARYFEGDRKSRTILVADPCAHPSALRLFKGRIVMAGVPFDMMKWIEDVCGEKGELAHGGSVSTNAYDLAKRLGCSKVILTGQDLAFSGGLAHARGSYLDEQSHLKVTRLWNEQMMNRFQLSALPKIMVRSISGGKAHTNQKMMIFISWFEKRNDPDLVNATRNGSLINGVTNISDDQIDLQPVAGLFDTIDSLYEKAVVNSNTLGGYFTKTREKVRSMADGAAQLAEKTGRAAALSDELCTIMESGGKDSGKIGYILGRLSEADKQIESMGGVKDMVGLTVQRVLHTITEGYDAEPDGSVSKEHSIALRSKYLYQGLYDGCAFSQRILAKMDKLLEM